jgi:hypothetical protein
VIRGCLCRSHTRRRATNGSRGRPPRCSRSFLRDHPAWWLLQPLRRNGVWPLPLQLDKRGTCVRMKGAAESGDRSTLTRGGRSWAAGFRLDFEEAS